MLKGVVHELPGMHGGGMLAAGGRCRGGCRSAGDSGHVRWSRIDKPCRPHQLAGSRAELAESRCMWQSHRLVHLHTHGMSKAGLHT